MWKVPENCSTFVYHDSSTTGQTKFLESTRIEMLRHCLVLEEIKICKS
jgi:hypothetical protein